MNSKSNSITRPRPHNPARNMQFTIKIVFFVLAGVSIIGAAAWSTYSLYELMSANSAAWAAVMACGVLDVAWVASLAMLIADVYGGDWRAEVWSWGTMAASMAASALHGAQLNSWTVAILGVLFTLASKGLTATYLHTLRPMLTEDDRNSLKNLDYQRRMREIRRQKEAELAADDYRWNEAEPRFQVVELTPNSSPEPEPEQVQLERLQAEPEPVAELEVPDWVNPVRATPELEPAKVLLVPNPQVQAVPVKPEVQVPEPPVVVPAERPKRVEHLAREIGRRGGQIGSVPLAEVIETYGLKPTAKATASTLRKDAHQHFLSNAPGTGNFL